MAKQHVRDAAIVLSKQTGWRLFPVRANKAPLFAGWQARASNDPTELERMFGSAQMGEVGIGLPCGSANGLVVIDVDTGDGKDGLSWLSLAKHFLPYTTAVKTPSGGYHIYLRAPEFEIRNSAGMISEGVDVRGEGGYVVVPPTCTPKGAYRWLVEPGDHAENIAEMPELFRRLITRRQPRPSRHGRPTMNWELTQRRLKAPIPEGQRNTALASRCGTLCLVPGATCEWVRATLHAINQECCSPPLQPREVDQVFRSIWKTAGGRP